MTKKRKGPRSRTSPISLAALQRRLFVLQMRMAGASFDKIAQAAIVEFGKSKLPRGWDSRYAYKDLVRYWQNTQNDFAEGREELRELELKRLDTMMMPVFLEAAEGDKDAIRAVLGIMDRRAKLTGIDAPIEYTSQDIQEVGRMFYSIVTELVKDENIRTRIFDALREAAG